MKAKKLVLGNFPYLDRVSAPMTERGPRTAQPPHTKCYIHLVFKWDLRFLFCFKQNVNVHVPHTVR